MNREMLEQPFDRKFIKQRKGNFGAMLDYIETHVVIQRLNDALDGMWDLQIVEYQQLADEVVVMGKLTAGGVTKMQFGSSKVTRWSTGEGGTRLAAGRRGCVTLYQGPVSSGWIGG